MENNLLNEFARDLQHGYIHCLFEEPALWKELKEGEIDEEGPFGDIEVDILDFLKTQPYYRYIDIASRNFSIISTYNNKFDYEMSCKIYLHEAQVKYDWDNVENEDDEPEEKLVDLDDVNMTITANYTNYKLKNIGCMIFVKDENINYELWPMNEIPDSFGGRFGEVDE